MITGTIERDGFQLRYLIEGTGPTTVVIGSSIYYPRTFSKTLRRSLRLVFMDHRGFVMPPGPVNNADFSLDKLIEDIEALRKTLGIYQVIVIGHSGHGYLALEYSKKYAKHVSHLVLLGMGPDQSPKSILAARTAFEALASNERKEILEKNLELLDKDTQQRPDLFFINFCIRMSALSWYDFRFDSSLLWEGVYANNQMFDHVWQAVFGEIDITHGLEKVTMPVFLGLGRYDFLVAPPEAWDSYKSQFKNLRIRIFEKSGHNPQMEEADYFDRELLNWLALTQN